MSGKRHTEQEREEAYRTWRACGRNIVRTVRELEKNGLHLDRRTIYTWIDTFSWKNRLADTGAAEQGVKDPSPNDAARLIADLERQKEKYDRFFETLGESTVDNQATYAYTTLVRAIAETRKKAAEKPDLYAMTPVVMDAFVTFVKAQGPQAMPGAGTISVEDIIFDLIDRFFEEVKPDVF